MGEFEIRKKIEEAFTESRKKRIETRLLLIIAREKAIHGDSDFAVQKQLLKLLAVFKKEGKIYLPKAKKSWNSITGLPEYITLKTTSREIEKKENQKKIDEILSSTDWKSDRIREIIRKKAIYNSVEQYEMARDVDIYLSTKKADDPIIPVRERSLEIFGDEKKLDDLHKKGLFSGEISARDLNCFYCPEPLPYESISMNVENTRGKPLLIVENSNTFYSCCRANEQTGTFAAIVYGMGFKASSSKKSFAGPRQIEILESRFQSSGIYYFGDLDPAGLKIPMQINKWRREEGLPEMLPATDIYQALLEKKVSVKYGKKDQQKYHNPQWAHDWLGQDLSPKYLEKVDTHRWPQEALRESDLTAIFEKMHPVYSN